MKKRAQAISIYSFNSLANKAWWREGTLCTVTMQALYQPPTLGTINISALSDTHCMWASLALTPTAERNNELLKNMKQQREGGRARAARETDQLHTTEQLLIIALFLSWTKWGLFELLWSLDTAGRICTHVSLLWSYCSPCCSLVAGTLLASI